MTTRDQTSPRRDAALPGGRAGPRTVTGVVSAARGFRRASVLALPLLATACISVAVGGREEEALPPEKFHVLEVPAPAAATAAATAAEDAGAGRVVAVRSFRAADRFDRHVVRREGPGRVTTLDRDYWADEPSQAVTDVVREVVGTLPGVRAVVDPADAHASDLVVDGRIDEFAWISGTPSRAVVRIRLTTSDPKTGRILATALREAVEDLPGEGTDGLGVAMGRAVARAAREGLGGGDAAGR